MQLDRITAVLRPRTNWEAVDLGVLLLRRFHASVLGAWIFTVLPVCALVMVVVPDFWSGLFVIWLLRPMFDRVPLFILARSLFGATPTLGETLRELPRLWTHDLWGGLIGYRLSFHRSLIMPVGELEGLRGSKRRRRQALVSAEAGGAGFMLGFVCVLFELVFVLGAVVLCMMMVPGHLLSDYFPAVEFTLTWELWLLRFFYALAFTAIGPMYVACGFALYINRRTHLEGWDIELGLRSLGRRLAMQASSVAGKGRVGALLVGLVVSTLSGSVSAQSHDLRTTADPTPEVIISEILAHEDFNRTHTTSEWKWPEWEFEDDSHPASPLLAALLEILLWGLAIGVVFFLFYQACLNIGWIKREVFDGEDLVVPPKELFGLDLRPETLPDDVPGAALRLWESGDGVGALGLLYRAAISRLVEHDALELTSSDTERDCLMRVRELASVQRVEYFASVTSNWQVCAYSHEPLADAEVRGLCDSWSLNFEGAQS